MGAEDGSRNGKRKVRELCGSDGARLSIAVSSEYGETQVSARRTAAKRPNMHETGGEPGASVNQNKRRK